MRGLRTLDAILLATVLATFSLVFFLHVNQLVRGSIAWIPLYVYAAPDADAAPTVRAFWIGSSAVSGLEIGDRLLEVGTASLSGVGPLGFVARVYEQAAGRLEVGLRAASGGSERVTQLELMPVPYPWRKGLVAISFMLVGALSFWRTRGSQAGRIFFLASFAHALHWCDFWGGPPVQTYAAVAAFGLGASFAAPLTLRIILVWPEEVARHDRASEIWPWAFVLCGLFFTTWAFGFPFAPAFGQPLAIASTAALIVTSTALLTINYRRSTPAGRRQIKWVVLGFYIGLAPTVIASALALIEPSLWWLYETSLAFLVLTPICLFIALVRFNLFDIDRLITATASFSLLSVLLLAGLLIGVPRFAAALESWIDPAVSQVFLSLGVAALLLPAQRRLERGFAGLLFPERMSLEREVQGVSRDLGRCDKPEEVLALVGTRVGELVRAGSIAIYGRTGESFAPVFAKGRAVAPAFAGDGPLIHRLGEERVPLDVSGAGAERAAASATEQGALEAMGIELVLPLVLEGELAAFVCVGEKGSGDVYTATDRALLQSIANRAADELRAFSQLEVERQQRSMSERLRSYVPGALADRLASGGELGEGEREVTVLFVDIREYTRFSESRTPDAIFAVINSYTRAVSGIVSDRGGAVVEFNGDGMMAVFGAPEPLPHKEGAAVTAAREIVREIRALDVRNEDDERIQLEVGVGIATGDAYVGSIRAVDRMIWSALGNTTNLAARLQTLTREYGAAIALDPLTYERASNEASGFEIHPYQRIRGRSERIHVYTLPLAATSSALPAARTA